MFTIIADVLDAAETVAIRNTLAKIAFVDGRATTGWHARLVKNNLQAASAGVAVTALKETIAAKIAGNPLFRMVARPKALTPLILSRYEPGMAYGSHVDDALMNGIRSDVSFTLFLSAPRLTRAERW